MAHVREQYAAYCYEFGYTPAQPNHLITYAKQNGVKVTWKECKDIIKQKPDTSDYVPPAKKDEQGTVSVAQPAPRKSKQELLAEKRLTAKRYSTRMDALQQFNHGQGKLAGMNKRASADRYQYLLTQLTAMGWQMEQALAALKAANGNLQLAQEALISGGGFESGPSASFSGGNGLGDKINKFNTWGQAEGHALDGGKYITRDRNGSNAPSDPALTSGPRRKVIQSGGDEQGHALDGGKYIKRQQVAAQVQDEKAKEIENVRKELMVKKVDYLKRKSKELRLSAHGNKSEMVDRIIDHMYVTPTNNNNSDNNSSNGGNWQQTQSSEPQPGTTNNKFGFKVSELTSLGWQREDALAALEATNGDLELAKEYLHNGKSVQAGPNWAYSHGGGSLADRINKFNSSGNNESHALDGGKYVTRNRNGSNAPTDPALASGPQRKVIQAGNQQQPHALDGGKYIQRSGNASSSPDTFANIPARKGSQPLPPPKAPVYAMANNNNNNTQSKPWQQPQQGQGSRYNALLQFDPNHAQNNNNNVQQKQWTSPPPQQQQQPMQPDNPAAKTKTDHGAEIDDAFEKLLSGRASIKHRLQAMDVIYDNLDELDITADNGEVLLSTFAEQLGHEDYIYREYAVRSKALQQMADVFIFCLNKVHYQDMTSLIDTSLPAILDALYKLMNDNRSRRFHAMAEQCVVQIIDAVIGKRNKSGIVALCGLLNEKINCEFMTQAYPRFVTAQQIFQKLIFVNSSNLINELFNIDIHAFSNKIAKWNNGVQINQSVDIPSDRLWFDIVTATECDDIDDETLKDIIADCVSLLMLDPNSDLCAIGTNLAVLFTQFNANFADLLEVEAKHRFKKFYTAAPPVPQQTTNGNTNHDKQSAAPSTATQHDFSMRPLKPTQPQNKLQQFRQQHNGEPVMYRINQETAVNVAAPTLPDL